MLGGIKENEKGLWKRLTWGTEILLVNQGKSLWREIFKLGSKV